MSGIAHLRVAVAGMGPMGRGIARVLETAGASVTIVDVSPEVAAEGLRRIREEHADGPELDRITVAPDVASAAAGVDLFIEAIVEDMAVKQELIRTVFAAGGDDLIFASNTSSLSIGEMGRASTDASRVIGAHFFNPPTRMRLVEVIRSFATSESTLQRVVGIVEAIGKTPVVCWDSPNFIVNRVCRPLYYEAELLMTQGVEPAVIDSVARRALGHPMGPLQLLDFTGLHTHLASSETALRELGDPRYRPIPVVRTLVRSGMTGRAAGRGFYDYAVETPRDASERVVRVSEQTAGAPVRVTGPDAASFPTVALGSTVAADDGEVVVYRCLGRPTDQDFAALESLARTGRVVLDASSGEWLGRIGPDVGWVRVHARGEERPFVEVVEDRVAGVTATDAVTTLLGRLGAASVTVLALPGLVADRLANCIINEATVLVEEGIATAEDIDVSLRLAMNHERGPFEMLRDLGVDRVHGGLTSMAAATGDPRYRPSQHLRRMTLGRASEPA
jgi:3-hydroxybutyryl-CoA dehydrogenase